MSNAPLKLNWAELLPGRSGASSPDVELVVVVSSSSSSAAAGSAAAAAAGAAAAGAAAAAAAPHTSNMESSSSLDGFPLTEFTDHQLQEKIQRLTQTLATDIIKRLPDCGAKLRSNLRQLQDEQARREFARTPKSAGDCEAGTESTSAEPSVMHKDFHPNATSSASQSSFAFYLSEKLDAKADDAFSEELRIFSGDKHKDSRENGSQMLEGVQIVSQATSKVSRELPTQCFANNNQQKFPSTRRRKNEHSCMPKSSKRKLWNRMAKRTRDSEARGQLDLNPKKVRHVVLLDDEDVQPIQLIQGDVADECDNTASFSAMDSKIYYPSRDDPESVEISYSDIKCLEPASYLSSTIMNFYVQYLQRSLSSIRRTPGEFLLFNTYFYKKLVEAMSSKGDTSACFLKLRRWWKGVNIFQKAYILLPIHGDMHWSLVIICIPAKETDSGLVMLHLDSLGLHTSNQIFNTVQSYLKAEWEYMMQNAPSEIPLSEKTWEDLPRRIEKKKIPVPQQKNEYDCGLFVLHFLERFIREAPDRLCKQDIKDSPMFGRKWFEPEEASGLRNQIKDLLIQEFEISRKRESPPPPSSSESEKDCTEEKCHTETLE